MSMTEEQAIEELEGYAQNNSNFDEEMQEAIETVLNMLKEKDKEIEKLKKENETTWKLNENMSKRHLNDVCKIKNNEKEIDLMAEYIATLDIEEDICIKNKTNPNWCNEDYTNCKDCIKQYFKSKAEKE